MQNHTSISDPDVLEAIDDLTIAALEIRWQTDRLVGLSFGHPERAVVGRRVDELMAPFAERAPALGTTPGVLFEIVSASLPEPFARAA